MPVDETRKQPNGSASGSSTNPSHLTEHGLGKGIPKSHEGVEGWWKNYDDATVERIKWMNKVDEEMVRKTLDLPKVDDVNIDARKNETNHYHYPPPPAPTPEPPQPQPQPKPERSRWLPIILAGLLGATGAGLITGPGMAIVKQIVNVDDGGSAPPSDTLKYKIKPLPGGSK